MVWEQCGALRSFYSDGGMNKMLAYFCFALLFPSVWYLPKGREKMMYRKVEKSWSVVLNKEENLRSRAEANFTREIDTGENFSGY